MLKISKIIKIIFIIIFSSIFLGGLICNQSQIKNAKFIPLLISFVIFFILWIAIYSIYERKVKSVSKKSEIIAFTIISIVIILIEIVFGYYLATGGEGWDLYVIIRAAKNIANNAEMHIDDVIYFQGFTQNRFIVVILALVYKIFAKMNITDTLIPGITINIFMIYISLVFLYFIVRKLYNNKTAIFMFASTIFLTSLFLYVSIFYTDTTSMPFIMLTFLLYLFYKDVKNKKKKILILTLMMISLFIGLEIKMTVIFIGIAILIDIILSKKTKENILYILYGIFILAILLGTYNNWINKSEIFPFDTNDKTNQIPYMHWVMMGINTQENYYSEGTWYGTWRLEDFLYTLNGTKENSDNGTLMYEMGKATTSYDEKRENAKNRIKQKINELGIFNFVKYLYLKSVFIFADGTYYAPAKISIDWVHKDCWFTEFFRYYGKNFNVYFYMAEGIHMVILFLTIISTLIDIKEKDDKLNVCRVAILELFVFLLVWEARSRYVFNYILIIYILSIPALQKIARKYKNYLKKIWRKI